MAHPTKVVHWKKERYDILITRPLKWGNPFRIGTDGNRAEVIKKFKEWILTQPQLLADLDELDGKILGCWCKDPKNSKACHGDVLIDLLNERKKTRLFE